MLDISDEQFNQIIAEVMQEMPEVHLRHMKNIAVVMADEPTPEERVALQLRPNQSLYGLYQGVPLPQRHGFTGTMLPDKITLYKKPLLMDSDSYASFRAKVKHTLWHEIAHYYGLDHSQIEKLEQKNIRKNS